jgi:hypothetical protein
LEIDLRKRVIGRAVRVNRISNIFMMANCFASMAFRYVFSPFLFLCFFPRQRFFCFFQRQADEVIRFF